MKYVVDMSNNYYIVDLDTLSLTKATLGEIKTSDNILWDKDSRRNITYLDFEYNSILYALTGCYFYYYEDTLVYIAQTKDLDIEINLSNYFKRIAPSVFVLLDNFKLNIILNNSTELPDEFITYGTKYLHSKYHDKVSLKAIDLSESKVKSLVQASIINIDTKYTDLIAERVYKSLLSRDMDVFNLISDTVLNKIIQLINSNMSNYTINSGTVHKANITDIIYILKEKFGSETDCIELLGTNNQLVIDKILVNAIKFKDTKLQNILYNYIFAKENSFIEKRIETLDKLLLDLRSYVIREVKHDRKDIC